MARGFLRSGRIVAAGGALMMVLGLGNAAGTASATTPPGSVIPPVLECAELKTDFAIPGAPTHVTAATPVDADPQQGTPAHCLVEGFVEPAVKFQLKLPTDTFTGRYVQYGCGGLCGMFFEAPFPDCGVPHGGDAAVAVTNDGHESGDPIPAVDGTWAANNRAARDDFAFRAPHVVSLAAKRIIATYYGSAPKRSYFNGCSTGGREGLLLAQRYPHDFDGIIAGAPVNYFGPIAVFQAWLAKANTDPTGAAIITSAKLPALHDAVLAACDRLDGLADGQLDDPRACRFDPGTLQCAPGTDQPNCLTPAQVTAARKLYAGPTDAQGRRLYPGGDLPGSELAWDGWIVPFPGLGSFASLLADNYLRYMGYPIGTPHSSLAEFQFTVRDFHRLTPEGLRANAMSLDLREFRRSGGKLILYHGWADMAVPPAATLDYYQRFWQRNGGLAETQEWARLFMVPTLYHCADGDRLKAVDPFRELVAWVERGTAPERIIATGTNAQGQPRSRPVFAYPLRAAYDGTGSIDDASNFVPARPPSPPRDAVDWVGSYLHHIPGPVAR